MELPSYWRRAAFAVTEAAEIIGVPTVTLRTWLARAPHSQFLGTKTGGRIWFSGNELYYYSLVSQYVAFGVSVRTAMLAAVQFAREAADDLPRDEFLVVHTAGGKSTFEVTARPDLEAPALVIPLRKLATDLIERATQVYATEAA